MSFGLLALILFLMDPSRAAAAGAGCATADTCGPNSGNVGLTINCDPPGGDDLAVTPTSCGAVAPLGYSLLRVAVRCFDPGQSQQARYTDRHGFTVSSGTWDLDTLVSGCANFMAAAHWNLNGLEVQAQCVKVVNPALVPDCVAPTADEAADLSQSLRLYASILPVRGTNSCAPDPGTSRDLSWLELRSGAAERSYQGVVGGRYLCTQSTDVFAACDDITSTIRPRGQYGNTFGYTLGPNDYRVYKVNEPGVGFNHCCDSELRTGTSEDTGALCTASNAIECSPLDIMCATSVGMAVCRAGPTTCALPSAPFLPLTRVIWHGPTSDIDPGDSATASASDAPNACFRFSFSDLTLANEKFTTPFNFANAPVAGTPTETACGVATNHYRDTDFDEVYDACDPVVGNIAPADGVQKIVLKNRLRNQRFSSPFDLDCDPYCDTIHVGGIPAAIDPVSTSTQLTVQVPATPVTGLLAINRNELPEESLETAPQLFVPRWFGYISDGTVDRLPVLDTRALAVVDAIPSPTHSRVTLNCDPADTVASVAPPRALAARRVESALTPEVVADREVFAVSEVTLSPSGTQTRLFGFKVPEHVLLGSTNYPAGIPLPASAVALDVADNAAGTATAYVAWKWMDNFAKLTAVNVENPADNNNWGASVGGNLTVMGEPLGLRVQQLDTGEIYAYVTGFVCSGEDGDLGPMMGPGFHCEADCEGGPPLPKRTIFLSVLDITNPANMIRIAEHNISETGPGCSERPALDTAGMAFNFDRTKLFVANPDADRVEILDVATHTLDDWILVGDEPVDVAVVQTAGPLSEERAYVANRLGGSVSVVRVTTPMWVDEIDLTLSEPTLPVQPVAIAALADGTRLFVANNQHGTIKVVNIDTGSSSENTVVRTISVGPAAKRLVLLTLPPMPPPPP